MRDWKLRIDELLLLENNEDRLRGNRRFLSRDSYSVLHRADMARRQPRASMAGAKSVPWFPARLHGLVMQGQNSVLGP
jgi:hypothetical protein